MGEGREGVPPPILTASHAGSQGKAIGRTVSRTVRPLVSAVRELAALCRRFANWPLWVCRHRQPITHVPTVPQALRTRTPGYAPVLSPFSNVTWPLTMIQ